MSATTDLGKVGITVNGAWSGSVAYEKNSIVNDGADSYISIQNVPIGTALSDTAYWTLLCNGFSSTEVIDAVNDWLDDHPEATTTVQDGAVTLPKLGSDVVDHVMSKNLLDVTKIVVGFLQSDGTTPSTSTLVNYRTSDFIPVEASTSYFFACFGADMTTVWSNRYCALQFDDSKNALGSTYQNVSSTQGIAITTWANAKYIRVSYWSEYERPQVELGSIATSYVPYVNEYYSKIELGETPIAQVEAIATEQTDEYMTEHHVPIVQTKQLFDRSKNSQGYCNVSGMIDPNATAYAYTELIDVSEHVGDTIYFSIKGSSDSARFVTAYDSTKTVISASGAQNVQTYTVPSGVAYIRITQRSISYDANFAYFQAEYDEITPYVEYGRFFTLDGYDIGNVLNGKRWAVCGDSFTYGATSTKITEGIYSGMNYVYPYLIGNRNNMEILKFFDGGKTLAYPASGDFSNSLTNPSASFYYQNIPADVDYITIYLGINDSHHEHGIAGDGEDPTGIIPLGEITDNTTATYYGAWNVVLTWLITNRPFAHIGILVSNGVDREAYRTAQLEIAQKYGIPYIDLNGDSRTPVMIRSQNPNIATAVKQAVTAKQRISADNGHPNDAAHLYESYFIENFLRSI